MTSSPQALSRRAQRNLWEIICTSKVFTGVDGLEALARIRSDHPGVRVIVLSMHDSPDMVRRAIGAGAVAYLRKDAGDVEPGSAIQSVMTTGSYITAGDFSGFLGSMAAAG